MTIKLNRFFILFISCFILSCSNDDPVTNNFITTPPSPEDNFPYPYELNTFWYYTTKNFVTNPRPDSVARYYPLDTLVGFGGAVFVKDTIVNSDTLRLLSNTHSEPGHEHLTLEYYRQTDSGLIRIASFSDGASFGPYNALGRGVTYEVNGLTFHSVRDLLDYYSRDNSFDEGIIFDDPPITVLKYPIIQGEEWNLLIFGSTRITKRYTDFETVTVPAGTFRCIKVRRNWYYNNNATADPKIISYDYFSKDGMMKRDLIIKDILVNNFSGPIGYIDVKEEIEVNIYTHP